MFLKLLKGMEFIMKKFIRCLLLAVTTIILFVPAFGAAEAASVALIPLINNVQGDELAGQLYFKEALNVINSKKGFVLEDNDKLNAAIEAASITRQVPDEAALAQIAKDGDVDIVIAMQLDVLNDEAVRTSEEDKLKIDMQGYAVAYNRINGVYYKHRIYSNDAIPEVFSSRWDLLHEEWGKVVRVEIDRALRAK